MATNRLDPTFVRAQIEALRYSHPGIWEDGDETLLADMLEAETGLYEFFATVVHGMRTAEAFIVGMTTLMDELKARRDRYEQREEALRGLALALMQHANVRKIELPQATLSIRAGSQKVIITDESSLPPDCVRVRTEPNKTVIKEQLERGEHVPGAEMSNREEVLAVRVK
jgi:hypothetical protein